MLLDSFAVRHDQSAYVGFIRRSSEMLEQVMRADIANAEENRRRVAEASDSARPDEEPPGETVGERPVLDKPLPAQSDQR
jgi:glutathione-regulated potassium-efflux system ancillary protein KefC